MSSQSSSVNPPALAQSEVREVLQYVPIFSGQTFVVALDGEILSDTTIAEVLLDLISLQKIGIQLVISYAGEGGESFLDWAAEVELKVSIAEEEQAAGIISRGQAAVVFQDRIGFDQSLVSLAKVVTAQKILYLGRVSDFPDQWVGAIKAREAKEIQTDNMISPLVMEAIDNGVDRVHLLDGTMPGCLSRELFSNEGVGVMIYRDSYQEIRVLSEEDIPELLAIIGRSIRAQHLLPRTYEELEQNLQDYYVMQIDGNVVGSVALYPYEGGLCELACLFVKESHKGLGYGHQLVEYAEKLAMERGFRQIFALSTGAGGFFERQLNYHPMSISDIPTERQEKLKKTGRDSVAIIKDLR